MDNTQDTQTPQVQDDTPTTLPITPAPSEDSEDKGQDSDTDSSLDSEPTEPAPDVPEDTDPTPPDGQDSQSSDEQSQNGQDEQDEQDEQEQDSQEQGKDELDPDFSLPPFTPTIPLPPVPDVPGLPTTPIDPLPPSDEGALEGVDRDFLAKLESVLSQNENWKEQVYLTLQGLSRVLYAFESLRGVYAQNHTALLSSKADIEAKKQELEAQFKHFSTILGSFELYFGELGKAMSENSDILLSNMNICIKQVRLGEKTLLETQKMCNDILTYRSDVLLTLEKLKALAPQKEELLKLIAKGEVYINEIKATQEQILESFTLRFNEIKAELETKKGELLTELQEHKESLQDELVAQEEQIAARLEAQIKAVDDKIIELEQSFIKKQGALDLCIEQMNTLRSELERLKSEYATLHQEKLTSLQEAADTHKIALEGKKQEIITSLNDEAHRHHQNLTELKEAYKKELDFTNAAEIAQIKAYIEQIQATTTQFGSNFKRVSITQSEEWTPPIDGIYYYVFIQGGTGESNSSSSGAPTSFGNYLSARGGAGSPSGLGLRGECASGFITLPDTNPISVSVGSGGICIISYTQKEAK